MSIASRNPAYRGIHMMRLLERLAQQEGAIGYIALWLLGVPASVLFVIFVLRGCD
jgi:hypothetical protein